MAIAINNLGTSANPDINSNTDASSYLNTSWTPPTTGIIVVFVITRLSSGLPVQPTMSGNSLTWTVIKSEPQGSERLTMFAAKAAGATTGQTTISFSSETQQCCTAEFCQITGAYEGGTIAQAFVQTPANGSGSGTTGTVNLSAGANSNNRPISCFYHRENEVTTPRTNWTELDDLSGTSPIRGLETQWRSDAFETTSTATWATGSRWIGIAAEIKIASTDYTKTLTNTVGITDSLSKVLTYSRTLSNTVGVTDSLLKARALVRTLSNQVGITDTPTKAVSYAKTLSNTVGTTDLISKVVGYARTISDTTGITDLVSGAKGFAITISDTVGLTDFVSGALVFIANALHRIHLVGNSLISSLRGNISNKSFSGNQSTKSIRGNQSGKSIRGKKSTKRISGEIDD
jgi:hypothetical protein